MTHEFRTPLNSILALTRLLLDRVDGELAAEQERQGYFVRKSAEKPSGLLDRVEGDLAAEQERQVYFVRKSAENLSELVNDLLDLAKVEAGKLVVRPVEFE